MPNQKPDAGKGTLGPLVRFPMVHPLDRCQHIFAESQRNIQWADNGTGSQPPAGAPVYVEEQCFLCGAWRQRWE